nr:MAG TPA: hypothetical protein [Caudoviricetes sp.]
MTHATRKSDTSHLKWLDHTRNPVYSCRHQGEQNP